MIPYLFKLGPLKVGSYGVMLGVAFLICYWLLKREFQENKVDKNVADGLIFGAILGGILGAKIYFLLEHPDDLWRDPVGMIFTGNGLTWYGGLIGGIIAVLWAIRKQKGSRLLIINLTSPLLLLGYAIGRIGCLLAGDGDYGPPSNLPWAMAFPTGLVPTLQRVHPTPIYETLFSALLFVILWKMRKRYSTPGIMFAVTLIAYGIERFVMEFWRLTPKILFGWMSMAQIISVFFILMGLGFLLYIRNYRSTAVAGSRNDFSVQS